MTSSLSETSSSRDGARIRATYTRPFFSSIVVASRAVFGFYTHRLCPSLHECKRLHKYLDALHAKLDDMKESQEQQTGCLRRISVCFQTFFWRRLSRHHYGTYFYAVSPITLSVSPFDDPCPWVALPPLLRHCARQITVCCCGGLRFEAHPRDRGSCTCMDICAPHTGDPSPAQCGRDVGAA